MSLNPLTRFQQRIHVPRSLHSLVDVDPDEANPEWLGMSDGDKAAIWKGVKNLYRTGMFPTVSVCIRRHGEIVLNRAIGYRQGNGYRERGVPREAATIETPHILYSCSKAFSAMMVHLLAEQGHIDVHRPFAEYLPEFGANGKDNITIHQLLSHQAGIPHLPKIPLERLFDEEFVLNEMRSIAPQGPAGKQVAYHAVSAGFVFKELFPAVVGKTIQEFWREHVKDVLGLRFFDYGAAPEDVPLIAKNYATGFPVLYPLNRRLASSLGASLSEIIDLSNDPRMYEQIIPAGNMVATANEVSLLFQCLMNGGELEGKRLFAEETVANATAEVSGTRIESALGLPARFSAGFMLGDRPVSLFGLDNRHAFGHLGLTNNFCWADPERQISVALLTSGNPVAGTHYPALIALLTTIGRRFSKVSAA